MPQPPDAPTVVLTGGGTGGHIFPALAIGAALQRLHPEVRLVYVGGKDRMEARLVPERGIEFIGVDIDGFQRKLKLRNALRNLALPFRVMRSVAQCWQLLGSRQVMGAVGTGGYASLPLLVAAKLRGIPYVLNEQNAFPGLVTRWMASGAQRVYLGMQDAAKRLNITAEKVHATGNPVLITPPIPERAAAKRALGFEADRPLVVVLGGSLGAGSLNEAFEAGWGALEAAYIQLFWQCGKQYAAGLQERMGQRKYLRIEAFVSDMAAVYAAADLVVCRAGALTLSELQVAGRPAVLVPSPNVTDDHQTHNARALERSGMAVRIADAEATDKLVPLVLELVTDGHRLRVMQGMAGGVAAAMSLQPPAAERIAADAWMLFERRFA